MNKKFVDELVSALVAISKDKKPAEAFIKAILTPSELEEIATRWQIVKKLAVGEPQRKIAKDLKIGIGTVTRGSREVFKKNGGFDQALKKFKIPKKK